MKINLFGWEDNAIKIVLGICLFWFFLTLICIGAAAWALLQIVLALFIWPASLISPRKVDTDDATGDR